MNPKQLDAFLRWKGAQLRDVDVEQLERRVEKKIAKRKYSDVDDDYVEDDGEVPPEERAVVGGGAARGRARDVGREKGWTGSRPEEAASRRERRERMTPREEPAPRGGGAGGRAPRDEAPAPRGRDLSPGGRGGRGEAPPRAEGAQRKRAVGAFDGAVGGGLDRVPARTAEEEEDEAAAKRAEAAFKMWKAKRAADMPSTVTSDDEEEVEGVEEEEEEEDFEERGGGGGGAGAGEVDEGVVLLAKGSGRIDEGLLDQLDESWKEGLEGFDDDESESEDSDDDADLDDDDDRIIASKNSQRSDSPAPAPAPARAPVEEDDSWGLPTVLMPIDATGAGFADLGVRDPTLLVNIKSMGFRAPTAVQEASLPLLLAGENAVINAFTGSGKTAAYLVPILDQMLAEGKPTDGPPRAFVLSPSRELAIQVLRCAEQLVEGTGLRVQQVIGGANPNRQIEDLRKKKPHIVIATPGRLAELALDNGRVKLSGARHVVVDEVDQCLGDAFRDDVEELLKGCARRAQVVFASATGGRREVAELARAYMGEGATMLEMAGRRRLPPQLKHYVVEGPQMKFLDMLRRVYYLEGLGGLLVFVNDGRRVDIVVGKLLDAGLVAAPLKGDSEKGDRQEIMRRLRAGTLGERPLLVATEVAARGLDIPNLTHVINMDLPTDAEHYVHRAGRTARAGRPGACISLCEPRMGFVLDKIGRKLGIEFEPASIVGGKLVTEGEE